MRLLKIHDREFGFGKKVCFQFSILAGKDWLIVDFGVAKLEIQAWKGEGWRSCCLTCLTAAQMVRFDQADDPSLM